MCRLHPVHQSASFILSPAIAAFLYVYKWVQLVAPNVFGAIIACHCCNGSSQNNRLKRCSKKTFHRTLRALAITQLRQNKALFTLLWIGAINMFIYMPINALFPLMSMNYFEKYLACFRGGNCFCSWYVVGRTSIGRMGRFQKAHGKYHRLYLSCGSVVDVSGLLPTNGFYDICDMLYVDRLFCPIL